MRHADAGAARIFADDNARALTPAGTRRMARAARGLRSAAPTLILTSPLVRAYQTARIVARTVARARLRVWPALAPGAGAALPYRLARVRGPRRLVLVGHEPDLSRLARALLTHRVDIEFAKGAAALLVFRASIRPRGARLRWLRGPQQLSHARRAHIA